MSHRLLLVLCLLPSVLGTLTEGILAARSYRDAAPAAEPVALPLADKAPLVSLAAFQAERPSQPVSFVVFVHLTENNGFVYSDATHFSIAAISPAGERGSARFFVARQSTLGKDLLRCLQDGRVHRLMLTVLHPFAGEDEILRFVED